MERDADRFSRFVPSDAELARAAKIAVDDVLRLKELERVLIVTNAEPEVHAISLALYDAAIDAGAAPVLAVQPTKTQLMFMEEAISAALGSAPDVIISMSAEKIGRERKAIAEPYEHENKRYTSTLDYLTSGVKRSRGFWSPHVTRDMFVRTVPINYTRLQDEARRLKRALDEAVEVLITSRAGTNLTVGLRNRLAYVDDGDFALPGAGGNLPAGEAYISPEIGSSRGVIVYDASLTVHDGDVLLPSPVRVAVDGGYTTTIEGDAQRLRETVRLAEERALELERSGTLPAGMGAVYRRNARNIGELGIGLNPNARIVGNMLEDEKARRTCHIAIGNNNDEDAPALIHLDGLIREPTITAFGPDGRKIGLMRDGELLL